MTIKRTQYISILGILVIASACAALIGWQFDIVVLKSLIPGKTPMNPVSAITFLLGGTWLLTYDKKNYRGFMLVLCGLVTLIGFVHFVTYFYPINLRLDMLFFRQKIIGSKIPNLIAPNTALVFTLSGISMCKALSKRKWVLVMRQTFIIASFGIVYISILGYIFDIQPAYRLGGYSPMSLFTAVVFLFLNIGLFLSNAEFGVSRFVVSSLNGSRLLRRVLFIMLAVPPVTGYLRLLGERHGLYPTEFGVELNTMAFTIVVITLIFLYALAENKRQILNVRAERQLTENELKFRTVFHSLKEGVACLDFQGRILYCNQSYCNILGYTEQELVGQVVIELIVPDDIRPQYYERLKRRKEGLEEDYQTEIIKKNGEKIWIDVKSRSMANEHGHAHAYLVSVTDITEDRHKLQDLQAFSGSAAHDLNAPLGRIITFSEFLMDDRAEEAEKKLFVSAISETALTMRQLLKDLLTFSRLGTTQLEKKTLDVEKIVHDIVNTLRPLSFQGNIVIDSLPPVYGNEGAVRQLFTNLISNAIKYTSKKEHALVQIGAMNKSEQTVYYIRDNGVGLTQEQIGTLFTPFKRYHSDFEGNGLGLAIVKRVVEKHSGNIWAESVPGEGLTFHFTLSS